MAQQIKSRNQREGKYAGWNYGHHVRHQWTSYVSARRANIIQVTRTVSKYFVIKERDHAKP